MTDALPLKELIVHVVEPGDRLIKGAVSCRLDHNIEFNIADLESFSFRKWHPIVFDTFLIAAVVEFCDRSLSRSSMSWGRRFVVYAPVHEPFRWAEKSVVGTLVQALNLLTGDDWHFEFRARKFRMAPPAQRHMPFPSDAEAVIAFSDGMDSRAVDGLERNRLGNRLVRVRVGEKQQDVTQRERSQTPFTAIPYMVRPQDSRNKESSVRSRGFKFSVVSAMAAYLIDAHEIIVPESGQGALGPALLPVGHGYEDYRNHPVFTALMGKFIQGLLGHRIQYKFPRLWATKAETLREFVETCADGAKWIKTRSCWQGARQIGFSNSLRQCGICAACVLRRLSVHAAGLSESTESYVWESLQAPTWEEGAAKEFKRLNHSLREYAIAGVLHFEHLALVRKSMEYELFKRRHVSELARSLAEDPIIIKQRLDRMLEQHGREWGSFKDSLGRESFVRKWIGNGS